MKKRGSFCYFRGNSGGKELQSESLIGIIKCYNDYRLLPIQMICYLNWLDIHCNGYYQIFFENLQPNRRFGIEIVTFLHDFNFL